MHCILLQPSSTTKAYLESSATSTSTLAVIGAFECPAVGSSVFSSPLVELTTCKKNTERKEEKWISPNDTITYTLFQGSSNPKTLFSLFKVNSQAFQFVNILYFSEQQHLKLWFMVCLVPCIFYQVILFRSNSNNLYGIRIIAMLIESTPETVKIFCIFTKTFLFFYHQFLYTKCHIRVYQLHVLI